MNKSWLSWEATKLWCRRNPGQSAAIVSREGTFTLSYRPTVKEPEHATHCRAYGNFQPPYEDCTCGADGGK